jgi:endonuclease YncB( thermonuclease family)
LIDTPELSQAPYGRQAMQTLQRLAPVGTTLRIETDVRFRDQYGRTLGYLWTSDGRFINEEMVAAGMAVVLVYPPNVKYVDRLRAASAEAQRKKVGLWATGAFECSPRDHRAGRC